MAIYINNGNTVSNIFVNVNGEKKKIISAWVQGIDTPKKVFGVSSTSNDSYDIAPTDAYSNWNYTLNDTSNIITLNYYKGSETDVIVYANYVIGGKNYKTQIKSNADNATAYSTRYMFNSYSQTNCQNIKTIKFSENIDTSNVTNMSFMFYNCANLTTLDISNLDTSNVINMNSLFNSCWKLTNIDVSNFDTSKVTTMENMFSGLHELTSLDLSNFDTSNVTNMKNMFYICPKLLHLDISSFDTSKVTDMASMFQECSSMTSLDLSHFDTSNVTNMNSMFSYCSALNSIYVTEGKWITSQANTSNMFYSCGTPSVTYK